MRERARGILEHASISRDGGDEFHPGYAGALGIAALAPDLIRLRVLSGSLPLEMAAVAGFGFVFAFFPATRTEFGFLSSRRFFTSRSATIREALVTKDSG